MNEVPNFGLLGAVQQAFSTCLRLPVGTDWNERETIAHQTLIRLLPGEKKFEISRQDVYLGGDIIRPYLAVWPERELWLIHKPQCGLSTPRLLTEVGDESEGKAFFSDEGALARNISATHGLVAAFRFVPNVYLATLTNLERYQTRRYPLNIARLAQWLRFQHSGRVRVGDLALTFQGDLTALADDIARYNPDLLGISLNFGEIGTLDALISKIRATNNRPIICLGNVLAAWASAEVEEICEGFQVHVSYSYGERDLERVCASIYRPNGYQSLTVEPFTSPESIVVPDERLLADTLQQKGQASIETSFGCQYGRCTFCPRSHRGKGWRRPTCGDAAAVLERMAAMITSSASQGNGVLSIVDEDAFGAEGIDPGCEEPSIVELVQRVGKQGVRCEIYTRLEQIYHRSRSENFSKSRLQQLQILRPFLSRVFVGLESGSDSQLRRYGKGQTTSEAIDALRAGSMLGLPLEFGFITFDPLLSQAELMENLEFLARTDILFPFQRHDANIDAIYQSVSDHGTASNGDAVFSRVAYMATELELFVNSPYLRIVTKENPALLGRYDPSFARFEYSYHDPGVGLIAGWCRVWTEGTFKSIYRLRLTARSLKEYADTYREIVQRYREATFGLLLNLTGRFFVMNMSRVRSLASALDAELPLNWEITPPEEGELANLWYWVVGQRAPDLLGAAEFSLRHRNLRRDA